eukprot:PhM_4_TR2680/c0_g1_i2/m.54078
MSTTIRGTIVEGEESEDDDVVVDQPMSTPQTPKEVPQATTATSIITTTPKNSNVEPVPAQQHTTTVPSSAPPKPATTTTTSTSSSSLMSRMRSVSNAWKKIVSSASKALQDPEIRVKQQHLISDLEASRWTASSRPSFTVPALTTSHIPRLPPIQDDDGADRIRIAEMKLQHAAHAEYKVPVQQLHSVMETVETKVTATHKELDKIRRSAQYSVGMATLLTGSILEMKLY